MSVFDKNIQTWYCDAQNTGNPWGEASIMNKITTQKVMRHGALQLSDLEGNEITEPINIDRLKLYFA